MPIALGLENKVAAVTGASAGIGRATVERLAREGAKVAFCARRGDVLDAFAADLRARGAEVLPVVADASREGEMERFVDATARRFGRLDVLVNNAGSTAQRPFALADDATWAYDLSLKLMGAVRAARAAIPHLRAAGGGAIVNVSMAGAKAPHAASFPTSVSRAAGLAFTKALSQELAPDRIRVNAVALGWIKSRQQERRAEQAGLAVDEHYRRLATAVPLGRLGEPDEVATVILFLASDAAAYITGTCINVDGGRSSVL